MTEPQAARTRLMAQALGPFLLVVASAVFARYETMPLMLPHFLQDAPLIFVTGVFTCLCGLFMLAAHHHFNSPAAIAVTVLAIIFILRGACLAIFPEIVVGLATHVVQAPPIMLGLTAISALVGLWLSFVGWFAKSA